MALPTGTVTFLFTDIEGSTRLLQELGDAYAQVQTDHMRLMREAIAAGGGRELRTEGDAFFAVFPSATGAVRAAVAAQGAFAAHDWSHGRPLRVRMGMHTGEGRLGGDDYLGIDVNRAARIAAAGHGGQVLLSDATRSVVEHELPERVSLRDLGGHRLKDLAHPEHLYDLVIEGLPSEFPALKTLDAPVYLPAHLTAFVGREHELDSLTSLLDGTRLVTLTGPGGTGKTRLAVEAAARLADGFPDGTYFVDLSPITDPRLVADRVASALRLRVESMLDVLDVITDHLRDRSALLVLDNFEQVLDGAPTVSHLLRAAPRVRGLVTSRAPLGIAGEREVPVPPLEVPDPESDASALRQSEAVTLFLERARAVDPRFEPTDEALATVAEICARLDGLPLAIELAASRIRVLPPAALLEQLQRRLSTLVGGHRDAPERQRTLRAAIDWSYGVLDDRLRTLFRRLSVFAGGFTLDAATEVADPNRELGDAVELLDALLQHSLVLRDSDEDVRFRMLETIREFALERLDESAEAVEVRHRHAVHFLGLAENAEPHLTGPEQARWSDALHREHDNLRAAIAWTIDTDRGELALRLGAAMWRFWYGRGHLEEGRRWLDAILALPSTAARSLPRARALTALAGIAYWQSDFGPSDAAYVEALDIVRELGDKQAEVEALFNVAMTKAVMGEPETAMALLEENLRRARGLGDRRGEGWALWGLAAGNMFGGNVERAVGFSDEALRVFEEIGTDTWGLGNALAGRAGLEVMQGEPGKAKERVLYALEAWGDQGNALVIASQLRFLGIAEIQLGRPERAVRLAGAAATLRDKLGGKVPDAFFPFEDPKDSAAEVLDEETIERLWAEGQSMSVDEALAYAREED